MKILQIYPGKVWGGAEQYVHDLSRALEARGHEVERVCRRGGVVAERLQAQHVRVTEMGFGTLHKCRTPKRLAKTIDREGIDVLHIHNRKFVRTAIRAAKLAQHPCRVILTCHDLHGARIPQTARRTWHELSKIIFVSEYAKRCWQKVNPGYPKEKCETILNSVAPIDEMISPDKWRRDASAHLREKMGIEEKTPILMFTGRVRRSKGCEAIIRALSAIAEGRDFAMIFVGACKPKGYMAKLQRLAEDLGITDRVHFYGFTPDASRLVANATCGVQPSIVREACGLSNMEFMQTCVPVITTDNGAQPEYIISWETGVLVKPGDVDGLAEALRRMLDHPEEAKAIGLKGGEYFHTHLAYPMFIKKILRVYQP